MKCGWCAVEVELAGPASRCPNCGGSHWACPTATGTGTAGCRGQANPAWRNFCPRCGAPRPPVRPIRPDSETLPHILRIPLRRDMPLASAADRSKGFYPPSFEACYMEGRMLIAGERHIWIAPDPRPGADAERPLGMVAQAGQGRIVSLPQPLKHGGVALFSSTEGAFALSVHTGERAWFLENRRCLTPPVVQYLAPSYAVWLAVESEKSGQTSLLRYEYTPGACLELGAFEQKAEVTVPTVVRAGTIVDGKFYFVAQDAGGGGLSWYQCNQDTSQPQRFRSVVAQDFPEGELLRVSLEQLDAYGERGWFLLSHSNDTGGAIPLKGTDRFEVEWTMEPGADGLPQLRKTLVAVRDEELRAFNALGSAWYRAGDGLRFTWGRYKDGAEVKLLREPPLSDKLALDLKQKIERPEAARRRAASRCSLIPTPWGCFTLVASSVEGRNSVEIDLGYLDFPVQPS